jgi:hypothetical protein
VQLKRVPTLFAKKLMCQIGRAYQCTVKGRLERTFPPVAWKGILSLSCSSFVLRQRAAQTLEPKHPFDKMRGRVGKQGFPVGARR